MARYAACAATLLALAGCTLISPDVEVAVEIPPLPEAWTQALSGVGFTLVYLDGNGTRTETVLEEGERSAAVQSLKLPGAPILAYPRTASAAAGVLRPAGGFASAEDGRAALSWEDGPLAWICLTLREAGLDPAAFNVKRLGGYLAEKEDPWEWDLHGICQKIASGDFSAYDIDALPQVEIELSLPEGDWVFESPFRSPVLSLGEPLLMEVSCGMHAFFSAGERVDVYAGGVVH